MNSVNNIYFLGIGGIGMSAIARYYLKQGKNVYGYDKTPSNLTKKLEVEGAKINYSDTEATLEKGIDLVVYTPAIPKANVQFNWYKKNGYTLKKRSAILGEITKDTFCIAVAGSHGKTTVSSMIAHILNETIGCTAFLGGIASNFNSNYINSSDKIVVVEADEFDRSFLTLSPNIAVITSIDTDHLDVYGNLENITEEFHQFIQKIEPEGTLIYKQGLPISTNIRHSTYSLSENADFSIKQYEYRSNSYQFSISSDDNTQHQFELKIGGIHNIENALAAIAVAIELDIPIAKIKDALSTFKGIKRRFEIIFETEDLIFIDDYAHHPNEVKAFLVSVKEMFPQREIVALFQPHLFSRTKDFATEFAESLSIADKIYLLPIYPAREMPIEGVSSDLIANNIQTEKVEKIDKSQVTAKVNFNKPSVFVTIGAGDIDRLVPILKNEILNKAIVK